MLLARSSRTLAVPALVIVATVACAPSSAPAPAGPPASSARERMIGSWALQQRTVTGAGSEVIQDAVLGQQPIGRLFYAASGHMSLQMMREGRPQAITTPEDPAQAANARVVLGYDSYFGTFAVDEAAGTVTHHIEGSLFPEDLGKDFTRRFRLDGDTFELSFTSPAATGGPITRTLVFQRAR